MQDQQCVAFLQWALPRLNLRWPGFRKVRKQVCKRVDRRMRELGLAQVGDYREFLESHPEEWSRLDACCRITISRFYRDRGVFDALRERLLPELAAQVRNQGRRVLAVWSAGCASGEEPYTLAILGELTLKPRFPEVELDILATDAEPKMLERAKEGRYQASSLKDLPEDLRQPAFLRAGDQYRLREEFRRPVRFLLQDIRDTMPDGPFDLICCRHLVFTYFDPPRQEKALQQLVERLEPNGLLVAGKQEPLPAQAKELLIAEPRLGVYRLRHER